MLSVRRCFQRLREFVYCYPATLRLAGCCILIFAIQCVASTVTFTRGYSFGDCIGLCFGLNGQLLLNGFFWQPFTHIFLHATWWHLAFNVLAMLLLGRVVESAVGPRWQAAIFFIGGVAGGLGWLLVNWLWPQIPGLDQLVAWIPAEAKQLISDKIGLQIAFRQSFDNAICVGASGGVFALICAFCALFPDTRILAVWIFIPMRMRAKTLFIALVVLSLVDMFLIQRQVANAAHLVGGISGYLVARQLRRHYYQPV